MMEQLNGVIKGISEPLKGKMSDLETRMQTRWAVFERKWEEQLIEPDSKEGTIANAERRIRMSVQREIEKIWKDRMESEDKFTTNMVETLKSELQRLNDEVVFMNNRPNGSAASTVAASTGSGGSTSNFAAYVMQKTFAASQIELKGWGVWRNIRGTWITMDEAVDSTTYSAGPSTGIGADDLGIKHRQSSCVQCATMPALRSNSST